MIVAPIHALACLPILFVWWTHRRCERREYTLLVTTFLFTLALLGIVAAGAPQIATSYEGPRKARGFESVQLLATWVVCTGLAAIPMNHRLAKLLRNIAAIVAGEILLAPSWVS